MSEAEGWRVTIDKLPEAGELLKELKASSGYAITHVGRLERLDGLPFRPEDAKPLMKPLFCYLSFCRGAWSAPVLAVGRDSDGGRVWESWPDQKIERWRNLASWYNDHSTEGLEAGFPGFLRLWQDEAWHEPLWLSLHWYVEAIMSAGGIEGSIILAQSAFELLAWTLLVEDRKVLSGDGFDKLPAMDKLRFLLSTCRVPMSIPTSFSELSMIAKAENWRDGPQALTEFRNALVHPSPKKRRRVLGADIQARHEAWNLSLWFLEMTLLNLFGYRGKYASRVSYVKFKGEEIETVPWA